MGPWNGRRDVGTFAARVTELDKLVGSGPLDMRVVVDQIYARYQHEGLHFRHPRGGRARYLGGPLMEQHRAYLAVLAGGVTSGRPLVTYADRVATALAGQVRTQAPIEYNYLRRSAAATVTDRGAVVYHRPADQPRLSEAQLRLRNRFIRGTRRFE